VSGRCTVVSARITAAVLPDWDSPRRVRELSASRLPGAHELAEIAERLRRAVTPALDLPYPDPEAVRLAALAELIVPRAAGERLCAGPGCNLELRDAATGRRRVYCGPACRQRACRGRHELASLVHLPGLPRLARLTRHRRHPVTGPRGQRQGLMQPGHPSG
jgi:hypothetical protein